MSKLKSRQGPVALAGALAVSAMLLGLRAHERQFEFSQWGRT
jgi:hypothetical protein